MECTLKNRISKRVEDEQNSSICATGEDALTANRSILRDGCRDCFPRFSPLFFSLPDGSFDRINPSIESRNDITLMTPPVGRQIPHYVLASDHEPCAPLIKPGAGPRVQHRPSP